MDVEYQNKKIEKICTIASEAEKQYGQKMAEKIHLRIDQIRAADSVEQMIRFDVGRCHPLHYNRDAQYAVDLVHPMRLVFEKKRNEVRVVNIIEIADYHRRHG